LWWPDPASAVNVMGRYSGAVSLLGRYALSPAKLAL
jgi:hypothetical protein